MAISESRIKTEKIIESSEAGASGNTSGLTTPSSLSDLEPEGLTDLLPSSFSQFSNFKDIMNVLAKDVKGIYGQINNTLKIPSLGDFENSLNNTSNRNANPVNQTLGIFHSALCGDGEGIDFHLRDLINALAYDFGFLNWNICGRQKLRNPMDIVLNSANNMRKDYNALVNLGPRVMKNLQKGVNNFIKGMGLPKNLEACMLDNALSKMKIEKVDGIPPGALKNLKDALNPDICKRSNSGVPGYTRTTEKAKVTPLVTGLVNYNETTMYAFHGSILGTDQVTNDIVMEVLCDSIKEKDSTTLFKTLQLIAFTKATAVGTARLSGTDVMSLTYNLHQSQGSSEDILDSIITANEGQSKLDPVKTVSVKRSSSDADMNLALNVKAETVLNHMKDDLITTSKDPEKKFYQAINLLKIADPKFNPEEASLNISECVSIKDLAVQGGLNSTYKTNKKPLEKDTEEIDGITYIKVRNDITLMDQVIGGF